MITAPVTFLEFHILIFSRGYEGVIDLGARNGGLLPRVTHESKDAQGRKRRRKSKWVANTCLTTLRVRANCAESFNFLCKWQNRRGNGSVSRPLFRRGPFYTKFRPFAESGELQIFAGCFNRSDAGKSTTRAWQARMANANT